MHSYIRYPHAAQPASLTPREVATAYRFPLGTATGKGFRAGIVELGGGFTAKHVDAYFTSQGLQVPSITSKNVGSGQNKEDGPDGADGEVQSDIEVFGAVAPGAAITVYFGGNSDTDFKAALAQALAENDGVTLSWGQAESDWDTSTMDGFEAVIKAARAKGVPLFVASGDSGSKDSTSSNSVDFPASSPSSIGCGGTRLTLNASGGRAAEVTWDDSDTSSASGGGVSKHFPGRDVPDIAGNADPDSGYEVDIDGQSLVIGGTSLVAPLMLGLYALLWELNGGKGFDFLNLIVTNPSTCFDVTAGDNGGFRAGPGRDETSGFGVPDGSLLAAALIGAPPVSPPVVTPPTPPVTSPITDFPTAVVDAWLSHKHTYTQAESAAAHAIVAWAAAHGIELPAA